MLRQLLGEQVVVGQFVHLTHAVHQDHLVVALVGLGVARDAEEGGQAGAGGQQPQTLARQQVVGHQRAGGLATDDDLVTGLDVLQLGGQRTIGHLDAEELQLLLVVGACDAVGTQQRPLALFRRQADHREMAVLEAQCLVTRGGETEQTIGPVMDGQNLFFAECFRFHV